MAALVTSYRDLLVWQKSMVVAHQVFDLTTRLYRPRWFALADQLRRSAVSVPSNIAEGRGRRSRGEFVRFISIANGSLKELETQLMLLARVDSEFEEETNRILSLTDEVGKMLNSLHHALRRP
jgi:four helix bundle protein